ncbi:hypothetical protein ACLOJK_019573 [Asimina triloba]
MANRNRPSRRPHADPSIQPIRISYVFFNRQQWWTTSCSSSMPDNTSSQRRPTSIQADAVQHQWSGSMRSDPGQQLRPNPDGLKPISPSSSSVFPMARPRATVQLTPTLHSTHLQCPTATARCSKHPPKSRRPPNGQQVRPSAASNQPAPFTAW